MDETDTPQNRSNDDAESKSSDENVSQNSLFFFSRLLGKVSCAYNYGEKPHSHICEMSLIRMHRTVAHFYIQITIKTNFRFSNIH